MPLTMISDRTELKQDGSFFIHDRYRMKNPQRSRVTIIAATAARRQFTTLDQYAFATQLWHR
ncbi:MAG: hypothetical protein GY792_00475 [Gammaproteobacteria bacterium]|nr:hypothetical protein [Gammaproteobacteria bacterium]